MTTMRTPTTLLSGLLAVLLTVLVVFGLGMRLQWPLVLRTVRRMNRRFINPRQLRSAGSPGAAASVVRHRGRRSGTTYETPVGAVPTDEGFVIALPYGTTADWVKNVLAGGSATIVHEGATHEVEHPVVVPLPQVLDVFPAGEQRTLRVFGVRNCLRLRTAA